MEGHTERGIAYRALLAAVIILGVLIVIALGVLVAGLVSRFSGHHPAASAARTFVPPQDARLLSTQTSGDRLILHLRTASGEEIDVVDLADGYLVARFQFRPSR